MTTRRRLTANQKAEPKMEATIAVEYTDAPIIRCSANKAFFVGNASIKAGETFYLVRSIRRPGRYYVVHFSNERHQWQCSCGANCQAHEHTYLAKQHVVEHVVKPRIAKIEQQPAPMVDPAPAVSESAYDLSKPISAAEWKEIEKRDRARQKEEKARDWERIMAARAGQAASVEICASAAPAKREQAPCKDEVNLLNGKREADKVAAYDAGFAAGRDAKGVELSEQAIEKRANAWIAEQKAYGYTVRGQRELRDNWTAAFAEAKDLAEQVWEPGNDPVALRKFAEQICKHGNHGLFERVEHPRRGDRMHSTIILYEVIHDLYLNFGWNRVRIQKWLDAIPARTALTTSMERAPLGQQ